MEGLFDLADPLPVDKVVFVDRGCTKISLEHDHAVESELVRLLFPRVVPFAELHVQRLQPPH